MSPRAPRAPRAPHGPQASIKWPAERFFWAVVEAPGWRRSGAVPEGLWPLIEDEVPVPAQELHAVGAPMPTGELLVCAARKRDLQGLEGSTRAVVPATVPPFGEGVNPCDLNLLVGAFEPPASARVRFQRNALLAGTALVALLLLAVGLHRRAAAWQADAAAIQAARQGLTRGVAVTDLRARLDRLRSVARTTENARPPLDAALALARVLEGWPGRSACTTHSVLINQDGAMVSLSVHGDPAATLAAIAPPSGWALDEPRLNSTPTETRVSLRLRPGGEP